MTIKFETSGTAVISSPVAIGVMKLVGFSGFVVYRRDRKNGFGMKYALEHAREFVRREKRTAAGRKFWGDALFVAGN